MTTNYEDIKNMTIDEMAELTLICFFTENKEGKKIKQYLSFDGSCYQLLSDVIKANKQWLQRRNNEYENSRN